MYTNALLNDSHDYQKFQNVHTRENEMGNILTSSHSIIKLTAHNTHSLRNNFNNYFVM